MTVEIAAALDQKRTQQGATLSVLSLLSPVLVVFLRHPGCTFCRESISDIARSRKAIEGAGVRIVLVHHGDTAAIQSLLNRRGLEGMDRIYDADLSLYRAFGLKRGTTSQLVGPKTWFRGTVAGILHGHGVGRVGGDPFQMPGAFLIHNCRMVRSFRHTTAADRPDYEGLAGAAS